MSTFRVAGAQVENSVGDLPGNAERIAAAMDWAEESGADALVLPELALTGYPLGDLVLRGEFVDGVHETLEMLAGRSGRTATIVGTVGRVPPRRSWDTRERSVAISAAVLCGGEVRGFYHKVLLPNYEGFEEARNFVAGDRPDALWRIGAAVTGISICEDMWCGDGPPEAQAAAGARILFAPNASPWYREKPRGRLELTSAVARRNGVPVVYVNCVGAQDELVFDGDSLVVDAEGELVHRCEQFRADRFVVDLELGAERPLRVRPTTVHARHDRAKPRIDPPGRAASPPAVEQAWRALVLGTRDFVRKNGMGGVTLGLSGGIDSAVTAAVAAAAVGPENVLALGMPAGDGHPEELADARELAKTLGIEFAEFPLDPAVGLIADGLSPLLELRRTGGVMVALGSRLRAALLYASADDLGYLTLSTTNKSELSIGSGALYGDVAGDFAPLKDCPKTLIYRIARRLNEDGRTIPERVLERPATAWESERVDLPPYEVLDQIVERYVEAGQDAVTIIESGFEPETVRGILQLIDDAEFKRRQAPPGVKITARAFGQDLRMPIANLWRPFQREQADIVGVDPAAAFQADDVASVTPPGREAGLEEAPSGA